MLARFGLHPLGGSPAARLHQGAVEFVAGAQCQAAGKANLVGRVGATATATMPATGLRAAVGAVAVSIAASLAVTGKLTAGGAAAFSGDTAITAAPQCFLYGASQVDCPSALSAIASVIRRVVITPVNGVATLAPLRGETYKAGRPVPIVGRGSVFATTFVTGQAQFHGGGELLVAGVRTQQGAAAAVASAACVPVTGVIDAAGRADLVASSTLLAEPDVRRGGVRYAYGSAQLSGAADTSAWGRVSPSLLLVAKASVSADGVAWVGGALTFSGRAYIPPITAAMTPAIQGHVELGAAMGFSASGASFLNGAPLPIPGVAALGASGSVLSTGRSSFGASSTLWGSGEKRLVAGVELSSHLAVVAQPRRTAQGAVVFSSTASLVADAFINPLSPGGVLIVVPPVDAALDGPVVDSAMQVPPVDNFMEVA